MTTSREAPPNLRSLTTRIDNLARERGRQVKRIQRAIANTVVGQMLPAGVVKGGTAMKVRVGEEASRFTPDLDAARDSSLTLEDYLDRLDEALTEGWGGFTGTITRLPTPQPEGVPEEYVMQPFDIRLAYRDRHWLTVRFELGRDEVGSTEEVETRLAQDILDLCMRPSSGRTTSSHVQLKRESRDGRDPCRVIALDLAWSRRRVQPTLGICSHPSRVTRAAPDTAA